MFPRMLIERVHCRNVLHTVVSILFSIIHILALVVVLFSKEGSRGLPVNAEEGHIGVTLGLLYYGLGVI